MTDVRDSALEKLEFQERFDARLAAIDELERFDAKHGVETSVPMEGWEMEEASDATLENNSRYSPTPVRTIRQVIAASPVPHGDMSFVDFGCGKGRVMLVASDFPFKKIIGVEFSGSLCETARNNFSRYKSDAQRCHDFEVHCQDVSEFAIPDEAGFFYFYEPFTAQIAEKVLDNIEASIARHPRRAILSFVGKALNSLLERRPFWKQVGATLPSPDDPWYDARLYSNIA